MHKELASFLRLNKNIIVLTGAGASTDSGVPDYRGPQGIYRSRPNYRPIMFQEFMSSSLARKRYWARSFWGWPKLHRAFPNKCHHALSELQEQGIISSIITQNVDGLHQAAGSKNVLELHGSLKNVICQGCHAVYDRAQLQKILARLNPSLLELDETIESGDVASSMNPDGDSDVQFDYSQIQIPSCQRCSSILKPDVVFFGENMKDNTRDESFRRINDASALLVVGSSLTVFSAFRLVRAAHDLQIPIAILNLGSTRGDLWSHIRIDANCSSVLTQVLTSIKSNGSHQM
jgi:NAD-dependent deacetylase sirtuin 4